MKLAGFSSWLGAALLLSLGVLYLGFGVDRTEFWSLFGAFTVSFLGFWGLVNRRQPQFLRWSILLGIFLRLALIFAFPRLSDDIYRFIWDGQLMVAGQNPFSFLPTELVEAGGLDQVPGLSRPLYESLNSPDYYTIYPPVAQAVFTLAAYVSPGSWYGASIIMKLFLFVCELGSLVLFWKLIPTLLHGKKSASFRRFLLQQPGGEDAGSRADGPGAEFSDRSRLLWYWLNPLIIIEILGNLHFEGAMVCFLLLALWWLVQSRWVAAAGAMALSVASKLLPLLLLPFLIKRLWGRPFWIFSFSFGAVLLVCFTPLLATGFLSGFGSSLDLYFRKFEFNASLYYLARAYGYYEVGWNQIARFGPLLAKMAAGGILLMALLERRTTWKQLPTVWLFAFVLYLLCATTVHPWYLSVPIALCVFSNWRFPLLWSFLIMLTYTNYLTVPYQENLWLVATEYVLVLLFALAEWRGYLGSERLAGK
jgi:alpha-1,6-mannosyltransferase